MTLNLIAKRIFLEERICTVLSKWEVPFAAFSIAYSKMFHSNDTKKIFRLVSICINFCTFKALVQFEVLNFILSDVC